MKLDEAIEVLAWLAIIAWRVLALMYVAITIVLLFAPGPVKWLALIFGTIAATTCHAAWGSDSTITKWSDK